MNVAQAKKQMCIVAQRMWQKGWVAANDGNISVRLGLNRFLTTATGISKVLITPEKIIEVNSKGEILDGNKRYSPTSEFPMHARCYKDRADINAVVHAHPPFSTAFAMAGIALDKYTLPEAIVSLGTVPVTEFAMPSTQEVPESIAQYLPKHNAILLRNHGALTLGTDLMTAYYRMETLELFAQTTAIARQIGIDKELTKKQVEGCFALREKYKKK